MAIPKWREAEGTDDGCSIFQCLNCYTQWESRTSPRTWKFCPHCGIKWEGQHECREHYEPRWKFELRQKDPEGVYPAPSRKWFDLYSELQRPSKKRIWAIVKREVIWRDGTPECKDWQVYASESGHKPTTLTDVVLELKYLRSREQQDQLSEDWLRIETQYRAMIIDPPSYASTYSTIWNNRAREMTLLEAWNHQPDPW
jgi:hypothetical protein